MAFLQKELQKMSKINIFDYDCHRALSFFHIESRSFQIMNKIRPDLKLTLTWVSRGGGGICPLNLLLKKNYVSISWRFLTFWCECPCEKRNKTFHLAPFIEIYVKKWPSSEKVYFSYNLRVRVRFCHGVRLSNPN